VKNLRDLRGLRGNEMSLETNLVDGRFHLDYRNAAAACYLEARPESGYIWKPYKQKLSGGN